MAGRSAPGWGSSKRGVGIGRSVGSAYNTPIHGAQAYGLCTVALLAEWIVVEVDFLVDLTALTRLDRKGTVAHWYNFNIKPVVDAFAGGDAEKIKAALYQFPFTYAE